MRIQKFQTHYFKQLHNVTNFKNICRFLHENPRLCTYLINGGRHIHSNIFKHFLPLFSKNIQGVRSMHETKWYNGKTCFKDDCFQLVEPRWAGRKSPCQKMNHFFTTPRVAQRCLILFCHLCKLHNFINDLKVM